MSCVWFHSGTSKEQLCTSPIPELFIFFERSLLFETAQGSRFDVSITSGWCYVVWEGLEEKWGEWTDSCEWDELTHVTNIDAARCERMSTTKKLYLQ